LVATTVAVFVAGVESDRRRDRDMERLIADLERLLSEARGLRARLVSNRDEIMELASREPDHVDPS
jgi:hypothetical protein